MNGTSIYDQLGGEPSVKQAVNIFYDKVLSDDELIEFFHDVNIDKLKEHQVNMFTLALGGPNKYKGRDMRKAHEHLKLEDLHFDLIKKYMAEALTTVGAKEEQLEKVMETVEPLRKDVLNR